MNTFIILLISYSTFYSSTQAFDCVNNNPCAPGGIYTAQNGYRCFPISPTSVLCTCPGTGSEIDRLCSPCSRSNPADIACSNTNGNLVACLDTIDYGTSHACLCRNPAGGGYLTTDANCDPTFTLTPRPMTTTTTTTQAGCTGPSCGNNACLNGGVTVGTVCHCPSGYSGPLCQNKLDANLCERIQCKNGGVCAIRNPNGPYEAICGCRFGTWGDYCEVNGTVGFCSSSSCVNGATCKEKMAGDTRHAYCFCQPGYNGINCSNRYFICQQEGSFPDLEMFNQGRYFKCVKIGTIVQAEHRQCPKGLRFNNNIKTCTY